MGEPSLTIYMRLHGYEPATIEPTKHVYSSPDGKQLTMTEDGKWTLVASDSTQIAQGEHVADLRSYFGL